MRREAGFTLIEVMIVVAVIVMVTMMGMANYQRFADRQAVVQAAEDLVTQLRVVQKKADAGERPALCAGELHGYRVHNLNEDQSASVVAVCNADVPVKTIVLKGDVMFDAEYTIVFLTLGSGVDNGYTISIVNTKRTCDVPVTVEEGGAMSVGQVGCT